jgi:uncharacterized protein YkwD
MTLTAVVCGLLAGPGAGGASAKACANADREPDQVSQPALARATVCLLNEERAQRGLRKLAPSRRLSSAARSHTTDMVRGQYFAHVSRSGEDAVDRIRDTGYLRNAGRWTVGENLAWGSGVRGTPGEIMSAWMQSPGHRANILKPGFREVGVGIELKAPTETSSPAATYTTAFGTRS